MLSFSGTNTFRCFPYSLCGFSHLIPTELDVVSFFIAFFIDEKLESRDMDLLWSCSQ